MKAIKIIIILIGVSFHSGAQNDALPSNVGELLKDNLWIYPGSEDEVLLVFTETEMKMNILDDNRDDVGNSFGGIYYLTDVKVEGKAFDQSKVGNTTTGSYLVCKDNDGTEAYTKIYGISEDRVLLEGNAPLGYWTYLSYSYKCNTIFYNLAQTHTTTVVEGESQTILHSSLNSIASSLSDLDFKYLIYGYEKDTGDTGVTVNMKNQIGDIASNDTNISNFSNWFEARLITVAKKDNTSVTFSED